MSRKETACEKALEAIAAMVKCERLSIITTGHKVGQNHRWKNWPGGHLGALVPCCRGKNDKKMVLGARLGMARPPLLQLSAGWGARLTFCESCPPPESGPPSWAGAGRQSPWPR